MDCFASTVVFPLSTVQPVLASIPASTYKLDETAVVRIPAVASGGCPCPIIRFVGRSSGRGLLPPCQSSHGRS